MNKIILVLGVSMMLSGLAGAHHPKALVNIEKAHKVIIKSGMSEHKKIMILKCLSLVKKFPTKEAAMEAKMTMIKAKCEKHNLDAKKCAMIKHKVAKKVAACFTVHNFMNEFFGRTPESK